jgi:hypothetical protein
LSTALARMVFRWVLDKLDRSIAIHVSCNFFRSKRDDFSASRSVVQKQSLESGLAIRM